MKKIATVHQFVPHLLVKRAQARNLIAKCRVEAAQPGIGIFWVLPENEILSHVVDISQAEPYGDFKTDGTNHFDMWRSLQRVGRGNPNIVDHGYDYWPRGRVSYNTKSGEFYLYADKKIVDNPPALRAVMREFSLPANQTEVDYDSHYRSPGDIGGQNVPYTKQVLTVRTTYGDGEHIDKEFKSLGQFRKYMTDTYADMTTPQQWQEVQQGKPISVDGDTIQLLKTERRPLQMQRG